MNRLTSNRMSIDEAAKVLDCTKQFLRVALQRGVYDFGVAIKMSGNRYTYYVNRDKLMEYVRAGA